MRPPLLPAFYINLDRHSDRRKHIEAALLGAGLAAQRIDAVDGVALGLSGGACMSPGEEGCYASHFRAWQSLAASAHEHALIVEDDALVPSELGELLLHVLRALPEVWDAVYLYSADGRATKPLARVDATHQIVRYSRIPGGSVAYLLSRKGATKLISKGMGRWPVDTELRRAWQFRLDVYGVSPPPVTHGAGFTSSLGSRRRARRGVRLDPLQTPRGAWWNIRQLGAGWWLRCLWLNTCRRAAADFAPRSIMEKMRRGAESNVALKVLAARFLSKQRR